MSDIETNRKTLNQHVIHLRKIMTGGKQFDEAIALFLRVHAQLHSAQVSQSGEWSFEDAILDDLPEVQFRRIPQNEEHSIAWAIWHIARIEDTAMNLLVAGTAQVLYQEDWLTRMNVDIQHSGNEMTTEEIAALSERVDLSILRGYRVAVGRQTREIVQSLTSADLHKKVAPTRLAQVMAQGALVEAASGVRDYWGKRTIAGLLLMPASRHILTHINEALMLKRKKG